MKTKRDLKYYIKIYLIVLVVYFIFISIHALQNNGYDMVEVYRSLYVPLLAVLVIYVVNVFLEPFFNRLKQTKNPKTRSFEEFFRLIDKEVSSKCDFTLEDFRRLRQNDRFQKACHQAYKIVSAGESEELNLVLLEKKFKKNTREYEATMIVIEEVKKMMVN